MFYIFSIGIPCWTANQINHIQRTRNCLSHQPLVLISCPTSSAVNFCTHFKPFFTGLFNTYNWNSNMQRLFRTSSIRILRQNYCLTYSHCFYRVSLTILSKILIKNFNCKRLRYKKKESFLLQVLSAKFNENFVANLLGVWAASIFVELYEESSSLYFWFIIYRKLKFRNVCLFIWFTFYKTLLNCLPDSCWNGCEHMFQSFKF